MNKQTYRQTRTFASSPLTAMALGMQRARLVWLRSQPTAFSTSSFRVAQLPAASSCTRKYAIAAAAKKKSEASPKATASRKPIPNASAKGSAKANKGPAKPTQGNVAAKPAATTSEAAPTTPAKKPEVTHAPPPTSTTTASQSSLSGVSKKKKEEPAISEQEAQLRQLEQLQLMSRLMPQVDPWGQQIQESLGGFRHLQFFLTFPFFWA